jgi:hypothetical protein
MMYSNDTNRLTSPLSADILFSKIRNEILKKRILKPKVRRKWAVKPVTKVHSTRKGAKGYSRKVQKKLGKVGIYSESEQELPQTW